MQDLDFPQRLQAVSPNVRVTPVLLGIIVLVFLATLLLGGGLFAVDGRVHMMLGSNFGPLTLSGQWWRVVTATFLHFGLVHIAFNGMALWDLGRLAERLFGRWHFLLLYLVAGAGGSFGTLLWNPEVNSAGASGALFGLIGGLLAFVSRRDLGVPLAVINQLRRSLLTFGGFALFAGFLIPGVDHAAHIGGLATGYLAGLVLARPVSPEARRRLDLRRLAGVAIAAAAGFVVLASWLTG